jgi:heme/copper-type cytochrome/quinol oxidase subunit 1
MGKVQFWLLFIGFNVTFFPMHQLGVDGMHRRVADYPAIRSLDELNVVATIGSAVIAVAVLIFIWNFWTSLRLGRPAGDDPWGGHTLEWATSSPPPHHNFTRMPPITSHTPVLDERLARPRAAPSEPPPPPPSRTQVDLRRG